MAMAILVAKLNCSRWISYEIGSSMVRRGDVDDTILSYRTRSHNLTEESHSCTSIGEELSWSETRCFCILPNNFESKALKKFKLGEKTIIFIGSSSRL